MYTAFQKVTFIWSEHHVIKDVQSTKKHSKMCKPYLKTLPLLAGLLP